MRRAHLTPGTVARFGLRAPRLRKLHRNTIGHIFISGITGGAVK